MMHHTASHVKNFKIMTRVFKNNFFGMHSSLQDVIYVHYASCFRYGSYYGSRPVINLEFEKRLCRSGYRKSFGFGLPHLCRLQYGLALDHQQSVTPAMVLKRLKPYKAAQVNLRMHGFIQGIYHSKGADHSLVPKTPWHSKSALKLTRCHSRGQKTIPDARGFFKKARMSTSVTQKELYALGLHQSLTSAYWLCDALKNDFICKKSPRAILNNLIRDVTKIMTRLKGTCPILGLRVVASGRLGKRKKGMAQQIRRSIGKVPLSTLKAKVDYCQDVVTSPRGAIGLKVWICYA